MKKRIVKILSLTTALLMIAGAVSCCYAESPATPTDLAEEETLLPQQEEEPAEVEQSLEVIITKALNINESWTGLAREKIPTVLKLDVTAAQTVHMVIEGKKAVWATVEKSDGAEEEPERTVTDPVTKRLIVSWEAEQGSYLIAIGPEDAGINAKVTVSFMDDEAYEAWEATLETEEPEPEPEAEPEAEPEGEPEGENRPESEKENERQITVDITWDVPYPMVGDTAHFKAVLKGYEDLQYTMQWQYSPDKETWYDLPGETGETMDVVVTKENNVVYWRILVYVEEEDQES